MLYPPAQWERIMKIQDVFTKAYHKSLTWREVAEILKVDERTIRRWKEVVDLGGASEFVLEAGDAGDAITLNWADWADAKVTLADGKEIWLGDLPLNQARVLWDPVITYVGATGTK